MSLLAGYGCGGFRGLGADTTTTPTTTTTGAAGDPLAALIGCPDRLGMAELHKSGSAMYSICYHLKRTEGKVLLIGAVAAVFFMLRH